MSTCNIPCKALNDDKTSPRGCRAIRGLGRKSKLHDALDPHREMRGDVPEQKVTRLAASRDLSAGKADYGPGTARRFRTLYNGCLEIVWETFSDYAF